MERQPTGGPEAESLGLRGLQRKGSKQSLGLSESGPFWTSFAFGLPKMVSYTVWPNSNVIWTSPKVTIKQDAVIHSVNNEYVLYTEPRRRYKHEDGTDFSSYPRFKERTQTKIIPYSMTSAVREGCAACFENARDRTITYWGRVKKDLILEGLESWLELEEAEGMGCN